jgi:hypothetical protein
MSSKELEVNLHELNAERDTERARLDGLLLSIRTMLVPVAEHFISKSATEAVQTNPDIAQKLGLDGLRQLKSEIADLVGQIPDLLDKALGSAASRPHYRPAPEDKKDPSSKDAMRRYQYFPQEVFRDVVSNVGPILDRRGLIREPSDHYQRWRREGSRVKYAIALTFPADVDALMSEYSRGLSAVGTLDDRIDVMQTKLQRQRASELWDQA